MMQSILISLLLFAHSLSFANESSANLFNTSQLNQITNSASANPQQWIDHMERLNKMVEEGKLTPEKRDLMELQMLRPELQRERAILYTPKNKIVTWKHFKSATTEYPPELVHFIVANIIVTYGSCFGFGDSDSIYKASSATPTCAQDIFEMFKSPLFYGGFYAFMVGNRYASPAVMNMFKAISNIKVKYGKKPVPMRVAQRWAGQLGMAFGFGLDQSFHKLMENHMLKECAKSTLKNIKSGVESLSSKDLNSDSPTVEVSVFNDNERYCVRAYRELVTSKMGRDTFWGGMGGLLIAAGINGMVTPRALQGTAYLYGAAGSTLNSAFSKLAVSNATPWAIRQLASGALEVGVYLSPLMRGAGAILSKTANLTGFLAISHVVAAKVDPLFKSATMTRDFRKQTKNLNVALNDFVNDRYYSEPQCPSVYETGKAILASGTCSYVPGTAELRDLHSSQVAWRQQKVLMKFMAGYASWQKRWSEFHTKFAATKHILQNFAQLREYDKTEKIASWEQAQKNTLESFQKSAEELANASGVDVDEVIALVQFIHHTGGENDLANLMLNGSDQFADGLRYLRFQYALTLEQNSEDLYQGLNEYNLFGFTVEDELSSQPFFERLPKLVDLLKKVESKSLNLLSSNEKQTYLEISKKLEDSNNLSSERLARWKNKLYALEDKMETAIENQWPEFSDTDFWYQNNIKSDNLVEARERFSFFEIRQSLFNYYDDYNKSGDPTYIPEDYLEAMRLSYQLLRLKKLSNLNPMTPEKVAVREILKHFTPLVPYQNHVYGLSQPYAALAGFNGFIEDKSSTPKTTGDSPESTIDNASSPLLMAGVGSTASSGQASQNLEPQNNPEHESTKEKRIWTSAPAPFTNADLFDYVVTSALCNGRVINRGLVYEREEKEVVDFFDSDPSGFSRFLVEPYTGPILRADEGFQLDFSTPRISSVDNNFCQRIVDVNNWQDQTNISIKSSVVLDSEGELALGLPEALIYDQNVPSFMDSETSFINWWNSNVYPRTKAAIDEQKANYKRFVENYLLKEADNTNREKLERAIEGLQATTDFTNIKGFKAFTRDYVTNMIGSQTTPELEYSNFKQSEDIYESLASEFGLMANYFWLFAKPFSDEIDELDALYSQVLSQRLPNVLISAAAPNFITYDTGQFLPEAFTAYVIEQNKGLEPDVNRTLSSHEILLESIKNTKELFVDILMGFNGLEYRKFQDDIWRMRLNLERLSQMLLPEFGPFGNETDLSALQMVLRMQHRQDTEILSENGEKQEILVKYGVANVLKRKPSMVALSQMLNILEEVEQMDEMRQGKSFGYDDVTEFKLGNNIK